MQNKTNYFFLWGFSSGRAADKGTPADLISSGALAPVAALIIETQIR